jgi:BlaI family transcriptional regulator, penicillinase repressor
MRHPVHLHLSRRESQIMDVIYHLGEASVAEVLDRMPDRPAYNTVRNTMATLERKGHLRHRQAGQRYLYAPADSVAEAQRSAVHHLLETFFGGSPSKAVLAVLGGADQRLSKEDLDEISRVVSRARKEVE